MSYDALLFEQVKGELNVDGGGLFCFWFGERADGRMSLMAISFRDLFRLFGAVA